MAPRFDFVPSTDTLAIYLREIGTYHLLSRAEESALAKRAREGSEPALEALICANLRFVVSVAKLYQHRGVALADLINEGNLGLMRAARRFDERQGVRFISYAVWWIRQSIVRALNDQRLLVHVPSAHLAARRRLDHEVSALGQRLGREPTEREIAEKLAVSPADLLRASRIAAREVSLDGGDSPDETTPLLELLADERSPAPDAPIAEQSLREAVSELLAHLPDREAKVVRLHFGLDGHEPMTLEQIGVISGITRERVRQIREKAFSRIRKTFPDEARRALGR
ncbi:MAG TPA: RNA polymerase sigma factor RpoD/SigA [Gemmatimonadaceae bacterium]